MGIQQPFMYDSDRRDSLSPEKPFDPKAVTRASWGPPPQRPKKKDGPLISFNRHPDAHDLPSGRMSKFRPMSSTTKWWVKFARHVQLVLRLLEMVGGGGLLVLMILLSNVDPLTSWVLRIVPGVVATSCGYAVWHLARPAHKRAPTSSAAYQLFAAFTDLAVLPLYAFGVISTVNHGTSWTTIMAASEVLRDYLVQSERYLLACAGGLHVVSLGISVWLALVFRRIARMPPDMNPLENHLTSRVRQHKRNKSSVATSYTALSDGSVATAAGKRLSTPLEGYRSSGAPYEDVSRPPSIPFAGTRAAGSRDSVASSTKRDSRSDLPSRQYQVTPGNSPRNSASAASLGRAAQRMSVPQLAQRASFAEVSQREDASPPPSSPSSSSPSAATAALPAPSPRQPTNASPTRLAKFTEAWEATESLVNRTQERQRALAALERRRAAADARQSQYEALSQRYNFADTDSDSDSDLGRRGRGAAGHYRYDNHPAAAAAAGDRIMRPDDSDLDGAATDDDDDDDNIQSSPINVTGQLRPNPLRLHPLPEPEPLALGAPPSRPQAASRHSVAAVEAKKAPAFWRRSAGAAPRQVRNSSIQPDADFYAKPYGELKPATPPIMVGGGAERKVSGTDYGDLGAGAWRRRVSGKVAEEGLAAGGAAERGARYGVVNE
ncbi:hypothetical protein GGS23DRAFT_609309 [Durotheca rogersii]|uniref:uncharacterized protein n=1 Tax=Durotheca rogersii TaxID=419775 RepID=UPI00222057D0|nr:uncharacterized protein GGS23DRAFT_609309 [Durotheca rogersii]KAI5868618.1 hypothetical protein GGS23DRAFT_609309 [Durotheca rogersii]